MQKEVESCWERIRVLWAMVDEEREKSVRAGEEVRKAREEWDEGIRRMERNIESDLGELFGRRIRRKNSSGGWD